MNAPTCRHLARKAFDAMSPHLRGDLFYMRDLLLRAASVPAYVVPAHGQLLGESSGLTTLAQLNAAHPGTYRLPAPITTIEFESFAPSLASSPTEIVNRNHFIIGWDIDASVGPDPDAKEKLLFCIFNVYQALDKSISPHTDGWYFDGYIERIIDTPARAENADGGWGFFASAMDMRLRLIDEAHPQWKEWQTIGTQYDQARDTVCGLICALACKNVKQEFVDAPHRLNAANRKRGKLALPGYHYLTLDSEEPSRGSGSGASHASPRLHIRRGHVRIVKGERPVWVRQHMVGKPGSGFINKDYNATRLTA